jgi:single-strand DNA-binding protein
MNKFIISGNITKEINLAYSASGKAYAKFTVAVTRKFDREKTDFFNVTAFGKQAENVANFLDKGSKVLVEGEVQIDNKDGKYYTNVLADSVEFLDSKKNSNSPQQNKQNTVPSNKPENDPFSSGIDIDSSELPF